MAAANDFGASVRARRRSLRITQDALARRAGSTADSIGAVEKGGSCGMAFRARLDAALAAGPARDGESPGKPGQRSGWKSLVAHGRASEGERYRRDLRKCLTCAQFFSSSWVGERVCHGCKATTLWGIG